MNMNFWVVGKLIGSSLNWNKIRKKQKQKSKNKAVTGNTRFFVNLIHFVLPVIFALTLASDKVVLYGNVALSILFLSTIGSPVFLVAAIRDIL